MGQPDRRGVMIGAGLLGTAAAVSACGSEGSGSGAGSGESGGDTGPTLTVAAADVPVGSGLVVDKTYAVTQPAAGEFHAFSAICTHQGCLVQNFTATEIVCPCHSSRFSTTDGTVISGPAPAPLPSASVSESGGQLTIGPA